MSDEYNWWTHDEIMKIYTQLVERNLGSSEVIDFDNPVGARGDYLSLDDAIYCSMIRLTDRMYRKTLDGNGPNWVLVSPVMCDRGIWYPYTFGHNIDNVFQVTDWKGAIREEVSPKIFYVGTLHCRWKIYVDEFFPDDVIMMGNGYKLVTNYKKSDEIDEYGYPKYIPYLEKYTPKNFALIKNEIKEVS